MRHHITSGRSRAKHYATSFNFSARLQDLFIRGTKYEEHWSDSLVKIITNSKNRLLRRK